VHHRGLLVLLVQVRVLVVVLRDQKEGMTYREVLEHLRVSLRHYE